MNVLWNRLRNVTINPEHVRACQVSEEHSVRIDASTLLGALNVDSIAQQCVILRGQQDYAISSWAYHVTAMRVSEATTARLKSVSVSRINRLVWIVLPLQVLTQSSLQ